MRWPRHVAACASHADERHGADGEVVWSWPPVAEAKFAMLVDEHHGRRGQERRSPRRVRISRKAIAQGRPDDPVRTCGSAACFLLHADHGCDRHLAFPAPSSWMSARETSITRAERAAGVMKRVCCLTGLGARRHGCECGADGVDDCALSHCGRGHHRHQRQTRSNEGLPVRPTVYAARDSSPGAHLAMRCTLSHKGRGCTGCADPDRDNYYQLYPG